MVYTIPGIRTSTADGQWFDDAARWFNLNCPDAKCDGFRYEQSALREDQREYVRAIAEELVEFSGRLDCHVMVHSDGSTKIAAALALVPSLKVKTVFMVEPDVTGDFSDAGNGLASALRRGAVEKIVVMCSPRDPALELEQWAGFAGYASRPLGLGMVDNLPDDVKDRVVLVPTTFAHSTAFEPAHRNDTFALAARHFGLAVAGEVEPV